jgi:cell division protein FtsB
MKEIKKINTIKENLTEELKKLESSVRLSDYISGYCQALKNVINDIEKIYSKK